MELNELIFSFSQQTMTQLQSTQMCEDESMLTKRIKMQSQDDPNAETDLMCQQIADLC